MQLSNPATREAGLSPGLLLKLGWWRELFSVYQNNGKKASGLLSRSWRERNRYTSKTGRNMISAGLPSTQISGIRSPRQYRPLRLVWCEFFPADRPFTLRRSRESAAAAAGSSRTVSPSDTAEERNFFLGCFGRACRAGRGGGGAYRDEHFKFFSAIPAPIFI